MARPKKKDLPTLSKRVQIRLTPDSYEILREWARLSGVSLAEYIRNTALGRTPKVQYTVTYDSTELLEAMRNLGRISGLLNQIARKLNYGDPYTEAIGEMLLECAAEMLALRDDVRKVIGEYHGNH